MTCNNPKLELVIMNAYIIFGEKMLVIDLAKMNALIEFCEILPIGSQDIEQKRNFGLNKGP